MANPKHAADLGSPVARLQKAAKRAKDEGDLPQAEKLAQAARDLEREFSSAEIKDAIQQLQLVQERGTRPKKVATQPTVAQLRKAADRARKAGVQPLAEKYDKVAADTARSEARDRGADLSEID